MKKKKETSQRSTLTKATQNYSYGEYYDDFSFRMRPVSDQFIDKLAHDLLEWARNDPKALKLTQFYSLKGIGDSDIKRWSERNLNLREAHARALRMIGTRREVGAITGELNPGMVASTMPLYDKAWKKLVEWKASLAAKKDEEKPIRVIVEQIPSSDLVPVKKKEE